MDYRIIDVYSKNKQIVTRFVTSKLMLLFIILTMSVYVVILNTQLKKSADILTSYIAELKNLNTTTKDGELEKKDALNELLFLSELHKFKLDPTIKEISKLRDLAQHDKFLLEKIDQIEADFNFLNYNLLSLQKNIEKQIEILAAETYKEISFNNRWYKYISKLITIKELPKYSFEKNDLYIILYLAKTSQFKTLLYEINKLNYHWIFNEKILSDIKSYAEIAELYEEIENYILYQNKLNDKLN